LELNIEPFIECVASSSAEMEEECSDMKMKCKRMARIEML
jgi:hypothetical protein